jgi:hypothetical protein
MESIKKYCPTTFESDNTYKIINDDVKLCYLKYLFFSYIITITSTGCPGLKWSLGNKKLPIKLYDKREYFSTFDSAVDNRFPYLLTENPLIAWFFKGASDMRGD